VVVALAGMLVATLKMFCHSERARNLSWVSRGAGHEAGKERFLAALEMTK
jgi:hypothetical protein